MRKTIFILKRGPGERPGVPACTPQQIIIIRKSQALICGILEYK